MTYLDFTNLDGMTEALTAEDIAEGQQSGCELCPVSLAVARMFDAGEDPGCHVHVSLETVTVSEHGGDVIECLCVSERLAGWIGAYDNEKAMKPITLCIYTWNSKGFEYVLDMTDVDV